MWMKYTLRAEACGGEGKGVLQTFCFQLTQMLGESQRLQHEKKSIVAVEPRLLTEMKLRPPTFHRTNQGLCQ